MSDTSRGKKIAVIVFALGAGLFLILASSRWLGWYYRGQGIERFQSGDYTTAKSPLLRSLRFDPGRPEPYFYLGKIALGKPKNIQASGPFYPSADYRQAILNYEKSLMFGIERVS